MGNLLFTGVNSFLLILLMITMFVLPVALFVLIFMHLTKASRLQKKVNKNSPVLTVDAVVIAKRADVGHMRPVANYRTSFTAYYVTFEVASGDRMELEVFDTEYGMLVETDVGKLTFQGSRYLGFERNRA